MSQSKKATKTVIILLVFSIISKLLGFIRESLIAAKFGSGSETDALFIALTTTTLFTVFITNAISTTMIPVLSEIEFNEGKPAKRKHASKLVNIIIVVSGAIVIVSWIFAPLIVKVMASGFKGEQFQLAVKLTRIGLPVIFFANLVGVFRGYLQDESMFIESAVADFPLNLTYIAYLIFFTSIFGIDGLMVASVIAAGTQLLVQIPGIKKTKFKYSFALDFKDKYVRKIIILSTPVLISVAINDINKIVDRSLASTLIPGSISSLNYASRLNLLILEVFVTSITTVIFPILSKEASKENYSGLKTTMKHSINVIIMIIIPATVGITVLAERIVVVAFQRGVFDTVATQMTTGALIFYSLGLIGTAIRLLLNKVYYSLQDTKTPMINGLISIGLNIVLNLILIRFMQHNGLALATSIAGIISTGYLMFGLNKRIGKIEYRNVLNCFVKSLIASLIMGIIVYTVNGFLISSSGFINQVIQLLGLVVIGGLTYFVAISLMRVDEISWFMRQIKKRKKKN